MKLKHSFRGRFHLRKTEYEVSILKNKLNYKDCKKNNTKHETFPHLSGNKIFSYKYWKERSL